MADARRPQRDFSDANKAPRQAASRYERIAKNEARFRETNEQIAAWSERRGDLAFETIELYCECGYSTCFERLGLTRAQYESVRTDSMRFAVLPGHQLPEAERVVEEHDGYLVVKKADDLRDLVQTQTREEHRTRRA